MSNPAVHWHEGMFLTPHHLQAAQRSADYQSSLLVQTLLPYAWGYSVLDIDRDAFANGRLLVRRLRARLPDGTLVAVPEDGDLPAIDLKPVLEERPAATVYLAVPVLHVGRANVASPKAGAEKAELARYLLDVREFDDENTGTDREEVLVRRLNLQLLLSGHDMTGYSAVPLAKVERSGRPDGRPQFQPGYIPPILTSNAWPDLSEGILQSLYDRIGQKADVLAAQVRSRGLMAEQLNVGGALLFAHLRALNEAYALLGGLTFSPGFHPLVSYFELCRLVGQLASFGPSRRAPTVPAYDHDDIGGCFYTLKRMIDELLDLVVELEYKDRPFIGAGLRMEVALEPAWVEPSWQMYIGVQSTLVGDELVRLLTEPGLLDMKIASSERVDGIYRYGRAGLRFLPVRNPPQALPDPTGITYFQLTSDRTAAEWPEIQKSLTLAIRLNENLIVGDIQGRRDLTVRAGQQTATMRFTLFVVPRKSLRPQELVD